MESPNLCKRIFGTEDKNEAQIEYKRRLAELSKVEKIVEGAGKLIDDPETGEKIIQPAPPKYCQCWFMELDDSPFSKWALDLGNNITGRDLLTKIDENLPERRVPATQ